ncbi:MAG: TIGR00730 family Rossman fold protein [Bacteroidota bacterium]|nr:TIGR00730 family Rossman fold protein [Bacteroidota bacterium]
MKELKTLCVFCASSSRVDQQYMQAARDLAEVCLNHKIHVLYGGGAVGLMGALADRMVKGNGKITGIIPDFMMAMEWAHEEVSEMIVVEDMRERKKRMVENVDAVVALPGGVGTLEELLEVITLKQLGRFTQPIIIMNINGFFNPLLQFFEQMIAQNFMRDMHRQIWTIIDSPEKLPDAVINSADWDSSAINSAAV